MSKTIIDCEKKGMIGKKFKIMLKQIIMVLKELKKGSLYVQD